MKRSSRYTLLVVLAALVLGDALTWFLRPRPDASLVRGLALAGQAILAFALLVWASWKRHHLTTEEAAPEEVAPEPTVPEPAAPPDTPASPPTPDR